MAVPTNSATTACKDIEDCDFQLCLRFTTDDDDDDDDDDDNDNDDALEKMVMLLLLRCNQLFSIFSKGPFTMSTYSTSFIDTY